MMDGSQIKLLMGMLLRCSNADNRCFTGVYAVDQLHSAGLVTGKQCLAVCIVNTDRSFGPGKHWIVVGVDTRDSKNSYAFVYDSLARDIRSSYPALADFLSGTGMLMVLRNDDAFQDDNVDSCALHVMYFVWQLVAAGKTFCDTVGLFKSHNRLLNDCELLSVFNEFKSCNSTPVGSQGDGKHRVIDFANTLPDTSAHCSGDNL